MNTPRDKLMNPDVVKESAEEAIPRLIVPWPRDDDRARYLGLRCTGFGIRDALGLIGKAKSTLSHWRTDSKFEELEDNISDLRKTLGLEYAALEFLRNYRLVLMKDHQVLKESLTKKTRTDDEGVVHKVPMDAQDFKYLLALRSHYTPTQLQAIEALFGGTGEGNEGPVNFTDYVLSLTRTKTEETLTVGTRKRQEAPLPKIEIVEGELVGD